MSIKSLQIMTSEVHPFPNGKKAAIVFSIDDFHPATQVLHGYEAGGSAECEALGYLKRLLLENESLKSTLFVAADWREKYPHPNQWIKHVPRLRDFFYLGDRWPESTMRLDLHPEFIQSLLNLPRTEIAAHGLYHIGKGMRLVQEFSTLSETKALQRMDQIDLIFNQAHFKKPKGFAPPGWGWNRFVLQAISKHGYDYFHCARDLTTPATKSAVTQGSGIHGMSLLYPSFLKEEQIIHIPSNWSATNDFDRAFRILESGGVLSVKAHAIKTMPGYTSVDGLDESFYSKLANLFQSIREKFGEAIWWATFEELSVWAQQALKTHPAESSRV